MMRPSTSFHLGDVITGEPHLHHTQWRATRDDLAGHEQNPRGHLKTAIAIHLPRIILIAWGVAGILFWLTGLAAAGWMTPECARRDLAVLSFIEAHGRAADVPAARLGEAGLAQLDARLMCLAGRHAEALGAYEAILSSLRVASRTTE